MGAGEWDDRGWDGWMASLTWWMWVWVNSGSWWWTGRPDVLRFMGSQRVGHDWVTELNWTELEEITVIFFSFRENPRSVWLVRIQSWAGRTFLRSKQTLCMWGPCQLWEAIDLVSLHVETIVEARKAFQFHPVRKVPKASSHAPLSLLFYLIFPLVPIRQLFRMSILYFF